MAGPARWIALRRKRKGTRDKGQGKWEKRPRALRRESEKEDWCPFLELRSLIGFPGRCCGICTRPRDRCCDGYRPCSSKHSHRRAPGIEGRHGWSRLAANTAARSADRAAGGRVGPPPRRERSHGSQLSDRAPGPWFRSRRNHRDAAAAKPRRLHRRTVLGVST